MHAGAASNAPAAGERFDEIVRADFFDGLRGDAAALDRMLRFCEDTLAKQPGQAEAMVWHGGATIAGAKRVDRSGDPGRAARGGEPAVDSREVTG